MKKWKENLEISLIFLGLLGTAVLIYLTVTYNQDSKEISQNLSSQLNELNSNVIQLLPEEPNITIWAVNEKNGSNTMEGIVYECQAYNPSLPSNMTFPYYDVVRIFIKNEGKETTRLKIDFDECMKGRAIFKICSELGQDTNFLMKEGPYKMVEIQEIGRVNPQVITLIYVVGNSPVGCNISYSSEDIIYNQTYVSFKE